MTKHSGMTLALIAFGAVACGGSYPKPNDELVASEAAVHSAEAVGATAQPQAQLYVKLAQEEIQRGRLEMSRGDNERAAYSLLRAKADADLALEMTRANNAKAREVQLQEGIKPLPAPSPSPQP